MGKQRFKALTITFIALIVLVVVLLMANSLRRTSHVTLPTVGGQPSAEGSGVVDREDTVSTVEITPNTVQAAIATLQRPEAYSRRLTAEWLWDGSSTIVQIDVRVSGSLTRVDISRDGSTRHTVTDGQYSAIWYDSENVFHIGVAADITPDQEQSIPTYEDVLELDSRQIAVADYRSFSDEACIFVETHADDMGVIHRYWVSVSSGLLTGAERLEGKEPFYRMAVQSTESDTLPEAEEFLLPDGSTLNDHRA